MPLSVAEFEKLKDLQKDIPELHPREHTFDEAILSAKKEDFTWIHSKAAGIERYTVKALFESHTKELYMPLIKSYIDQNAIYRDCVRWKFS